MIVAAIYVLAFLLLAGLCFWILEQLPIPEPIRKVIYVIMVVICVLILITWLLQFAGPGPTFPAFPRR